MFKALNDKWVSGGDYTNKTMFEDIMFLDRASRNIGDTILIDIFDLKNMFNENSLNSRHQTLKVTIDKKIKPFSMDASLVRPVYRDWETDRKSVV